MKARATSLQPGDLVLARNVSERDRHKISDKWEQDPYVVVAQPNVDNPEYHVKKPYPKPKKIRVLHRNLLLPLRESCLLSTFQSQSLFRLLRSTLFRQKEQILFLDMYSDSISLRPRRNRQAPVWQRTDDLLLK